MINGITSELDVVLYVCAGVFNKREGLSRNTRLRFCPTGECRHSTQNHPRSLSPERPVNTARAGLPRDPRANQRSPMIYSAERPDRDRRALRREQGKAEVQTSRGRPF